MALVAHPGMGKTTGVYYLATKIYPKVRTYCVHERFAKAHFPAGLAQTLIVIGYCWLPPRDSNPDMLIQSQLSCR